MRVQRRATGLGPAFLGAQEPSQVVALADESVVGVAEDLGDRAPSRPPGENGLFVGVGPATAVIVTTVENSERVEVRSELGGYARRGKVILTGGLKGRWARRYLRFAYRAVLIAWLISARALYWRSRSGSSFRSSSAAVVWSGRNRWCSASVSSSAAAKAW